MKTQTNVLGREKKEKPGAGRSTPYSWAEGPAWSCQLFLCLRDSDEVKAFGAWALLMFLWNEYKFKKSFSSRKNFI